MTAPLLSNGRLSYGTFPENSLRQCAHTGFGWRVFLAILVLLSASTSVSAVGPDPNLYTIDLEPHAAATSTVAFDPTRVAVRSAAVIAYNACERLGEFSLLHANLERDAKDEPGGIGEAGPAIALAIATYLADQLPGTACMVANKDKSGNSIDPSMDIRSGFCGDMACPAGCSVGTVGDRKQPLSIGADCLRFMLNEYIRDVSPTSSFGSSGIPCFGNIPIANGPMPWKISHGEWDIALRVLVPIFIKDQTILKEHRGLQTGILDEDVRVHMLDDLFTIRGNVGQEDYSLLECADQNHQSGSAEDYLDQGSINESALDAIGGALEWLWKLLVILAVISAAAAAASVVLPGSIIATIATAAVTLAVPAMTSIKIPETENHRLMIESDRYLINQLLISDAREINHPDVGELESAQDGVEKWLLKRMQQIVRDDFIEYNSRGYQRYSMAALRNLYDHADSKALKTAVHGVLDFASAKMAIGSSQQRRYVPFRRKMDNLKNAIMGDPYFDEDDHKISPSNGLFDLGSGSDHQIAAFELYLGPSRQLPYDLIEAEPDGTTHFLRRVSRDGVTQMLFPAVSSYLPNPEILRLATDKSVGYEQRFSHHTVEIFTSRPGFLLSAGGRPTDPSGKVAWESLSPLQFGPEIDIAGAAGDSGVSVPIVLMLSLPIRHSYIQQFLRIEGAKIDHGSTGYSFGTNLCVEGSFACGTNIRLPEAWDDPDPLSSVNSHSGRFVPGPPDRSNRWSFYDTSEDVPECPSAGEEALRLEPCAGQRVMIALFRALPPPGMWGGIDNVGFFEAVHVQDNETFAHFQADILAKNPAAREQQWIDALSADSASPFLPPRLSGIYTTHDGGTITFTTDAEVHAEGTTGAHKLGSLVPESIDDWPMAAGDVINTKSNGYFEFKSPLGGAGFTVDLSDWEDPKYEDHAQ